MYYKVVKRTRNGLISCTVEGQAIVEYKPGEYVSGIDNTPLFCFDCEDYARVYAKRYYAFLPRPDVECVECWSCDVKNARQSPGRIVDYSCTHRFVEFWDLLKRYEGRCSTVKDIIISRIPTCPSVENTIIADQVKLVRCIHKYHTNNGIRT